MKAKIIDAVRGVIVAERVFGRMQYHLARLWALWEVDERGGAGQWCYSIEVM